MNAQEFQSYIAAHPEKIAKIYTDGGLCSPNPSKLGGVWAWCAVDSEDEFIYGESGYFVAPEGKEITSHQAEFAAMTRALEAMPLGWEGTVCSDSELTINRFSKGHSCFNIPPNMLQRGVMVLEKLGDPKFVLLAHKPTKDDLEHGYSLKSGLPVSIWNKWCDKQCDLEKQKAIEANPQWGIVPKAKKKSAKAKKDDNADAGK